MTKPFFITSDSPTAPARPLGIALPFALGGGATVAPSGPPVSGARSAQIAAVTAAAAAVTPSVAFELAHIAEESFHDVLAEDFDGAKIDIALEAVQAAQDDPTMAIDVTSIHRAAAGAVGANPRLTAAAAAALDEQGGGRDAALWAVRLTKSKDLQNAARAVAKAQAISELESGAAGATTARLEALESGQQTINKTLEDITRRITALEGGSPTSRSEKPS